MEPQYNTNDFTGRTTSQTVTVKNYPWYDGWARGPNNADGTMGPKLTDANGNYIPIEQNWYNDSVKTNPDGSIMMDDNGTALDSSDDFPVRYYPDGANMQIEIDSDGPDGIPDNPGEVVWNKPVRTDMTANNNFNIGLSATLSLPLDKKLQKLCKQAAITQIEQQQQLTANKRLDFEIARLKNCGELMKAGIIFHPRSPYASICADVVIIPAAGKLLPHSHDFPRPTFKEDQTVNEPEANGTAEDLKGISIQNPAVSSSPQTPSSSVPSQPSSSSDVPSQNLSPVDPSSSDTHSSSTPSESDGKGFFQGWRLPWSKPASQQVSQPSEADQLGVLQVGQMTQPPKQ